MELKKRINSKRKGNNWELKLADWLVQNGIKASRDSASGAGINEKGDISNNLDMTIESKAAKNIKLMEWWLQVEKSASIHKNSPVLFIHQDGMGKEDWLVVLNSEDWLELVKCSKSEKIEIKTDNQQLRWKTENAIRALKE